VQLSERYGVSRTPLREALRMLQEEGLVAAASNRRARVRDFDLDDVEAISAQRILLSALATQVTVGGPRFRPAPLMTDALEDLERAARAGDAEGWRQADLAFHAGHEDGAPPLLLDDLRRLGQRNELYRSIWDRTDRHSDAQTVQEHHALLDACLAGDARRAVCAIARHQARIGITVLARAVPEREPATIRAALQMVIGNGAEVFPMAPSGTSGP
jgi:DNA-binding GntR family transcriptional regulator